MDTVVDVVCRERCGKCKRELVKKTRVPREFVEYSHDSPVHNALLRSEHDVRAEMAKRNWREVDGVMLCGRCQDPEYKPGDGVRELEAQNQGA